VSHVYPSPPTYRHAFQPHELDAIEQCHDEHGFAIVKGVLSTDEVDRLKADIIATLDAGGTLKDGETRYAHWFVEKSPAMRQLLANEAFTAVGAKLNGTDELTVNRSAAILKAPGSAAGGWHTDYALGATEPTFNNGHWPNGLWFYLTGSSPEQAGLAVIDGSHREDWPGPAGFRMVEGGSYFEPEGGSWAGIDAFTDVPGVVPIISDPGDLVIFAARTYHAPFAHRGTAPRHSVALILRPRASKIAADSPLTPEVEKMIAGLPEDLGRYFVNYVSRSDKE